MVKIANKMKLVGNFLRRNFLMKFQLFCFLTHTLSGLTQAMAMMMATLMKVQMPKTTQNTVRS